MEFIFNLHLDSKNLSKTKIIKYQSNNRAKFKNPEYHSISIKNHKCFMKCIQTKASQGTKVALGKQ